MPAPVKIEAPRIGVDLDGNAVLGACRKDLFNVHIVARPPKELAACHVAKNGDERMGHSAQNAFGLFLPFLSELAMDARHDEIEATQHIVRIVERAVREDVRFDALEDSEF